MKEHNDVFVFNRNGSLKDWETAGPLKHPPRIKKHDVNEDVIHLDEKVVIDSKEMNGDYHKRRLNLWKKPLAKLFGLKYHTDDMQHKIKVLFVSRKLCLYIRHTIHKAGGYCSKDYNNFLDQYKSDDDNNVITFETVENACRIFLGKREISEEKYLSIISKHEIESHDFGGHMVVRTMSLPDKVDVDMKQATWFVTGFGTGFGSRGVCQTLGYNNYNMIRGEPSGLSKQLSSVSFYYGPGDVNKFPIHRQCYNHAYVPPSVSVWNNLTTKAVNAMQLMDSLMFNSVVSTLGAENKNNFSGISCTRISTQAMGYLGFASSIHTDDNDYFNSEFKDKMNNLVKDYSTTPKPRKKPTALMNRRIKSGKYVSSFIKKYGVMAPTTCAYMFLGQFKEGVSNENVELFTYIAFPGLKKAIRIKHGMAIMWYAGLLEHMTTVPMMVVDGKVHLSSDVMNDTKGRIFAWGLGATAQH